ncbi:MAG: hypothetical protein ACYTEQ_29490 [Planctomycetota bacterium]|jgi:hypothetical protein
MGMRELTPEEESRFREIIANDPDVRDELLEEVLYFYIMEDDPIEQVIKIIDLIKKYAIT